MENNSQQPRVVLLLKKFQPTFVRVVNSIVYYLMSLFKSIVKSIINQLKGK